MVEECHSVLRDDCMELYFQGLLYVFVWACLGGGTNLLLYCSNEQRLVHFVYVLSACRRPSHGDINGWANGCWVLAS